MSLNWTKPFGNSYLFKVLWTDGDITNNSYIMGTKTSISNLIAGVQYRINVSSVAGDNYTEGKSVFVSQYTGKFKA